MSWLDELYVCGTSEIGERVSTNFDLQPYFFHHPDSKNIIRVVLKMELNGHEYIFNEDIGLSDDPISEFHDKVSNWLIQCIIGVEFPGVVSALVEALKKSTF